jgi:hypothetical protein
LTALLTGWPTADLACCSHAAPATLMVHTSLLAAPKLVTYPHIPYAVHGSDPVMPPALQASQPAAAKPTLAPAALSRQPSSAPDDEDGLEAEPLDDFEDFGEEEEVAGGQAQQQKAAPAVAAAGAGGGDEELLDEAELEEYGGDDGGDVDLDDEELEALLAD